MSLIAQEGIHKLSKQPMMAFYELYFGDVLITVKPPQNALSLEVERLTDGMGDNFTVTLFDTSWGDIEYLLLSHWSDIKFRYGYVDGLTSEMYNAIAMSYTLEFRAGGVLMVMKGVTTGVQGNLQPVAVSSSSTSPSDVVVEIANMLGWAVGRLDETENISLATNDTFSAVNVHPISYIRDELLPFARRKSDGASGYILRLDSSTNPVTINFYIPDKTDNISPERTYVYQKGVNTNVLNFTVNIEGLLGGSSLSYNKTTTDVVSVGIDPITGEEYKTSASINNVNTAVGEYTNTPAGTSTAIIDSAGYNAQQTSNVLNYKISEQGASAYTGTLEIVGDPSVECYEYIRILVITNNSELHHTSGIYLVTAITDSIDDGIMRTIMEVQRSQSLEGISIVNYHQLLK